MGKNSTFLQSKHSSIWPFQTLVIHQNDLAPSVTVFAMLPHQIDKIWPGRIIRIRIRIIYCWYTVYTITSHVFIITWCKRNENDHIGIGIMKIYCSLWRNSCRLCCWGGVLTIRIHCALHIKSVDSSTIDRCGHLPKTIYRWTLNEKIQQKYIEQ